MPAGEPSGGPKKAAISAAVSSGSLGAARERLLQRANTRAVSIRGLLAQLVHKASPR